MSNDNKEITSDVSLYMVINWNRDQPIKLDTDLVPKFTLFCMGLQTKPRVEIYLDNGLCQDCWNNTPEFINKDHSTDDCSVWSFINRLRLSSTDRHINGEGSYLLTIKVTFTEPRNGRMVTYRFADEVVFTAQAASAGLKITATENAVVNFRGRIPDNVIIEATDNTVVSTSSGTIGNEKPEKSQDTINVTQIRLRKTTEGDVNLREGSRTLRIKVRDNKKFSKTLYFYALHEIRLGRSDADLNYRFCEQVPTQEVGTFSEYLSLFIHREHSIIAINNDGLNIGRLRNMPVEIIRQGEKNKQIMEIPKDGFETISWDELSCDNKNNLPTMVISRMATMSMKAFPPVKIDDIEKCLKEFGVVIDEQIDDLWTLGKQKNVSSVKLVRDNKLTIKERKEEIENSIDNSIKKEAFVRRYDRGFNPKDKEGVPQQIPADSPWIKDNIADKEQYFIVLNSVVIGSNSALCPVFFKQDPFLLDNVHASICFCKDHFFLVNIASSFMDISAELSNGEKQALHHKQVLSLEPGVKFQLGELFFEVDEV